MKITWCYIKLSFSLVFAFNKAALSFIFDLVVFSILTLIYGFYRSKSIVVAYVKTVGLWWLLLLDSDQLITYLQS